MWWGLICVGILLWLIILDFLCLCFDRCERKGWRLCFILLRLRFLGWRRSWICCWVGGWRGWGMWFIWVRGLSRKWGRGGGWGWSCVWVVMFMLVWFVGGLRGSEFFLREKERGDEMLMGRIVILGSGGRWRRWLLF